MWRAHQITKAIQSYDSMLYAKSGYQGRIDIFRRTYRYEPQEVDGVILHVLKEEPYRVFCLTDTWNAQGKPVDWGVEPILAKLRASDLWKRDIGKEANAHNEKIEASKDRDTRNNIEAFVKDSRRAFADSFDGINTASMDKKIDRRRIDEKKINLKG